MVNRETNFNRKYQKKLKKIRNIRKAKNPHIKRERAEEIKPEGFSKKMAKRQQRYEKICNSININVSDIFSRKKNKKNTNTNKKNKDNTKMELE